ncbi:MAG: hypothetical protein ACFWTJ_10080 [Lachnoclostridium sp.]
MYKSKHFMLLKALTPMHVGEGNEIGAIDLPIQREVHTNFPKIEASSLKGCVRSAFRSVSENIQYENKIFGLADKEDMYAGAVSFTDARILFFPVRSAKGIYAYVTCPFVLERLFGELNALQLNTQVNDQFLKDIKSTIATSDDCLVKNNLVILEEFTFSGVSVEGENGEFKKFVESIAAFLPQEGMKEELQRKSILISDEEFLYFVEMATDVITRIRVNTETGTTDNGLFDEEYLPGESILYSFLFIEDSRASTDKINADQIFDLINKTFDNPIQIGGNSTLGKGFTLCKLSKNGKMEV